MCFYSSLAIIFFFSFYWYGSPAVCFTHRFTPTNQNLLAHTCFTLGLGKSKTKTKKPGPNKSLQCFLLRKKKSKTFLPVFQLFQAHDWLSGGRVLQRQRGRRCQSKVRKCACCHHITLLYKILYIVFLGVVATLLEVVTPHQACSRSPSQCLHISSIARNSGMSG